MRNKFATFINNSTKFLAIIGLLSHVNSCGEGVNVDTAGLTGIQFSGKVTKATDGAPIEGATVRLIKLLDASAIKNLIEYKEVPDGKGGKRDAIRIKLESVHNFPASVETTTDAAGQFKVSAPIQLYLVYTFGPGNAPGQTQSYTVNFWGINKDTGELDLDHLIGKDGSLKQENNDIKLAGGPEPAKPAPPPEPPAPPTPPAAASEVAVPTEIKTVSTDRPEEIPSPTGSSIWSSIQLSYSGGSIGSTEGVYEVAAAPLLDNLGYVNLNATLSTSQTDPVYLVVQDGFDTVRTKDCNAVDNQAKTYILSSMPNGTAVNVKFFPPGKYYKVFFAKTATKEAGKNIVTADESKALTVGTRACTDALPEHLFQATLSWDKGTAEAPVDLDLHVTKFERGKDPRSAIVDQVSWMKPAGTSLALSDNNMVGSGPETIFESKSTTDVSPYCYLVQAQYYSGAATEVNAKVEAHYVETQGDRKVVKKYTNTGMLKVPQDGWWDAGIFPEDCQPKEDPPVKTAVATDFSSCSGVEASSFSSLASGSSLFKGTGTVGGETVNFDCDFVSKKGGKQWSAMDYTASSDGLKFSISYSCRTEDNKYKLQGWFYRTPLATAETAVGIATKTSDENVVIVKLGHTDNGSTSVLFSSPNAYGSPSKSACGFTSGKGYVTKLSKQSAKNRPDEVGGCFQMKFDDTSANPECKTGNITARFFHKYK